jgi:hypothetical protein
MAAQNLDETRLSVQTLYDEGAGVYFLREYRYDITGALTPKDTTVSGSDYSPTGTVYPAFQNQTNGNQVSTYRPNRPLNDITVNSGAVFGIPETNTHAGNTACRIFTFQVLGTFSATLTPQARAENGTYVAIPARNLSTGATATTITAAGIYSVSVNLKYFRLLTSTFGSGSARVISECCFDTANVDSTKEVTATISGTVTTSLSSTTLGAHTAPAATEKAVTNGTAVAFTIGTVATKTPCSLVCTNSSAAPVLFCVFKNAAVPTIANTTSADFVSAVIVPANDCRILNFGDGGVTLTGGMHVLITSTLTYNTASPAPVGANLAAAFPVFK